MVETRMIDWQRNCHPDRSAAEWRDLLFAWVSNYATRRDFAANFRHRRLSSFPAGYRVAFRLWPSSLKRNGTSRNQPLPNRGKLFLTHAETNHQPPRLLSRSSSPP